ncbi:EAL domain-containing protein [Sphingomonas sp.]|uniref:putative bifunctional diguanylate cyclase/phosphodiesterase n=1 Tax=Sphingomonas sp. TaxID=28214 RepID=UPI00286D9613|nr:EAL domain-containing protein [Sphingomonas sp.]
MIFGAFRPRSEELVAGSLQLRLRDVLSLAPPADGEAAAIRRAQLDALVRLVPVTITTQLVAALLLCLSLRGAVPDGQLAAWFGGALAICVVRGARAHRLRSDPAYAERHPPELIPICIVIALLAALWLVPAVLWFGGLDIERQLLVCVLMVGLMSAGSVALATVPQAAIGYVAILTVGTSAMAFEVGRPAQVALAWIYAAVLCRAVIANTRQFIANIHARFELREQSELIALLREFEASGSDWLWEVDARLQITYISHAMGEAIGRPVTSLLGRRARDVVDPNGSAARLSTGMRTMFDHVRARTGFRDLAIPIAGGRRWWSLSGKPLIDSNGRLLGWRGVGSDITDIRLSGSDAVRAARLDSLTAIANRVLVREQLEEALLRQFHGDGGCALLLIDLDRFKLVNDTLGHAVGDKLLCEVARRLEAAVHGAHCVGRLGGDEFAIVWSGDQDRAALIALAERIIADLSRTIIIGVANLHVGATIGIAIGGLDGASEEVLMRSADLALYSAKAGGRGGHAFYEKQMLENAEDNRLLENDVRKALGSEQLSLAYQPIVDAATGQTVGREALLRWDHPTRGAISPEIFIPVIEDVGLIHQIGDWVMREACAEACRWPNGVRVAVNISAAQLGGAGLAKTVVGALAASGLDPARLELEVTENIFIGDDNEALASLETLRGLGVGLVLDDFGKGYSSLGYLSRARFTKIKIDQYFVRGAARGERECLAIVNAITALADGLDMTTTAEGVETEQEADAMRALGCQQLQGFWFGRPVKAEPRPAEPARLATGRRQPLFKAAHGL